MDGWISLILTAIPSGTTLWHEKVIWKTITCAFWCCKCDWHPEVAPNVDRQESQPILPQTHWSWQTSHSLTNFWLQSDNQGRTQHKNFISVAIWIWPTVRNWMVLVLAEGSWRDWRWQTNLGETNTTNGIFFALKDKPSLPFIPCPSVLDSKISLCWEWKESKDPAGRWINRVHWG